MNSTGNNDHHTRTATVSDACTDALCGNCFDDTCACGCHPWVVVGPRPTKPTPPGGLLGAVLRRRQGGAQ